MDQLKLYIYSLLINLKEYMTNFYFRSNSIPTSVCVSVCVFSVLQSLVSAFRQLCTTMYDYVWLCMTLYDYVWFRMTMYDFVWLCMTTYDYVWLCMTMYDHVCLCMTMYDYIWLCTMHLVVIPLYFQRSEHFRRVI